MTIIIYDLYIATLWRSSLFAVVQDFIKLINYRVLNLLSLEGLEGKIFCLYKPNYRLTGFHDGGTLRGSQNFLEPFEHLFSTESPRSSLTKQTVVFLKPTITANLHQMFLLY